MTPSELTTYAATGYAPSDEPTREDELAEIKAEIPEAFKRSAERIFDGRGMFNPSQIAYAVASDLTMRSYRTSFDEILELINETIDVESYAPIEHEFTVTIRCVAPKFAAETIRDEVLEAYKMKGCDGHTITLATPNGGELDVAVSHFIQ